MEKESVKILSFGIIVLMILILVSSFIVAVCGDSDSGKNYYSKGITNSTDLLGKYKEGTDFCIDNHTVGEYYCENGEVRLNAVAYVPGMYNGGYDCKAECLYGACQKQKKILMPNGTSGPIIIPGENEDFIFICGGCFENATFTCYPVGYVKENKFCSANKTFEVQLETKGVCANNFECKSNLCLNNECLGKSFIQRVIDWFKNLFGIK
jgi:hypothetical protein